MKKLLPFVLLMSGLAHASEYIDDHLYVQSGLSARSGSKDVAVGYMFNPYLGLELQYIDEGKQPEGIKNINRLVNFDIVLSTPEYYKTSLFVKIGATTSRFGHNGSGINYKNHTGFTGNNIGVGIQYHFDKNWSLTGQLTDSYYQQVDRPEYENFTYGSLGVNYKF